MKYVEQAPAPELLRYLDCLRSFSVSDSAQDPIEHTVPPDGGVSLAFSAHWERLGNDRPRLEPVRPTIFPGQWMVGIRFWPGAAPSLLGVPAARMRDCTGPAIPLANQSWFPAFCDRLVGCSQAAAAHRVFEGWLTSRLAVAAPLDTAVMDAVFSLLASDGQVPTSELSERSGLSVRQFRRRFRHSVGLSAEELARIRRVRASTVSSLDRSSHTWVQLADKHEYSDQAHLIHELRRLVGSSPKKLRQHLSQIDHRYRG